MKEEEEEEEVVKKHIIPVFPHFSGVFPRHNEEEGTESRGLEDEEYETWGRKRSMIQARRHFTRHSRRRLCAKADFQTFHGQLK